MTKLSEYVRRVSQRTQTRSKLFLLFVFDENFLNEVFSLERSHWQIQSRVHEMHRNAMKKGHRDVSVFSLPISFERLM